MKIREAIQQHFTRNKKFYIAAVLLAVLIVCANLLSLIPAWRNYYADHIYTVICDPVSHITNALPFPLGELLMYLAAVLVLLAAVFLLLLLFLRKKKGYVRFTGGYFKTIVLITLSVLLIYTVQWLTPYRSAVLGGVLPAERDYTLEEMRTLYLYVVEHINEACESVPRDADGHVIYDSKEVTEQKVSVAMNGIAGEFSRLKGYYPPIKAAWCSDVLDWMWIGGYTYPYTLEMTYNKYTGPLYFPSLYSHESSHHMGYYKEHEANFLSYLACANSDDPVLRYSAYFYVYNYVDDSYFWASKAAGAMDRYWEDAEAYPFLPQVWIDERESNDVATKLYQEDEHALEEYSDTAEEISEVGWETQSQILQEYDYDGVTLLMLQYYDGKLY